MGCALALLLVSLVVYLGYFYTTEREAVLSHPSNRRMDLFSDRVLRGTITDWKGEALAFSYLGEDGTEYRRYPYGEYFAHTIGYIGNGKTGLESAANYYLLTSSAPFLEKIYHELQEEKNQGDTLVTTMDLELTQIAGQALEGKSGAIVAIEPSTGNVLTMVSSPGFDPEDVEDNYEEISSDSENAPLLNRAASGMYPPGSVFKMITALSIVRQYPDTWQDFTFTCQGVNEIEGYQVRCSGETAHGTVNLETALEKSCNGYFAAIGQMLDLDQFRSDCESVMMNQEIPFTLSAKESRFVLDSESDKWEELQTYFGQGNTQVTPLYMALFTSAVANDGLMMAPRLMTQVKSIDDKVVKTFDTEQIGQVMTAEEADLLTDFMVGVVENGTGESMKSSSYTVAAKTGSAQFDSTKDTHAWVIAFAPAEDPQIAIAAILEESGSGGRNCGPVVKEMLDSWLNR